MNRFLYPVVAVYPTHVQQVAAHATLVDALRDAAGRDVGADPGVWHLAEVPGCSHNHRREH